MPLGELDDVIPRVVAIDARPDNERWPCAAIEPLGIDMPMYDITTNTENFIANGVVAHNCFARSTHSSANRTWLAVS